MVPSVSLQCVIISVWYGSPSENLSSDKKVYLHSHWSQTLKCTRPLLNCAGKWGHESIYLTPLPRLPLFWRKEFTILIPCLTRPSCPLGGILFTKTVVYLGHRRFTSFIKRPYCCTTWAGGWASRSLPPICRTTWDGLLWRGKIVSRRRPTRRVSAPG